MRELKYVQNNGSSTDGVATIRLYGHIGCFFNKESGTIEGIGGSSFASELDYLVNACNPTRIQVRINSYGGKVIDGMSIISAIKQAQQKVPVDTYVDGMAYSMAGAIALVGTKRYMSDFGTLMVHNPWGSDEKMLGATKESMLTLMSNNSSLTQEQLSKMMDEETYFNPSDAKYAGLIDEIVPSGKHLVLNTTNLQEMYALHNEVINPKEKEMTDNTNGNSNELNDLKKKIEDLSAELKAEQESKKDLETKLKAIQELEQKKKEETIINMVNSFIEAGAIDQTERESAVKMAHADFEGVKRMLTKLTDKPINILDEVKAKSKKADPRADWTMGDYEKQDPAALSRMQTEEPSRFEYLFNAYYKNK